MKVLSQTTRRSENCFSPILDMFNGEIISYQISSSPNMKMVLTMLKKVLNKKEDLPGLILRSDQGWQYQQQRYQDALKQRGIIQSMSRKGNCLDNSMMENFFGLMKSELLIVSVNRYQRSGRIGTTVAEQSVPS